MRFRRTMCLVALLLCFAAASLQAMPVERYIELRKELEAADFPASVVANSPGSFKGKVIELRGNVSGVASNGETARIILRSQPDHYIVTCESRNAPGSGSAVALLAVIGEGSENSLSDLRLVDWCHESELRIWEAAEAEKAVQRPQLVVQAQPERTKRTNQPASRGEISREVVAAYRKAIASFNPRLSSQEVEKITNVILNVSSQYDVDPRLVVAVVLAESNFKPQATSPKGAMGLGQLMPGTARGLGVRNAYDPEQNLAGAIKLIRGHLDKQSGKAEYGELTWEDLKIALACYNAGPGAVKKYGGIPPYRETQTYVQKVVSYYKKLCGISN